MLIMMVVVVAMVASGNDPMAMMRHEKPAHQMEAQRGVDPDRHGSSTADDIKRDTTGVEDTAARN